MSEYVVVLLNAYPCEDYEGKSCVMDVHAYASEEAARFAASTYPDWTAPHVLMLHRDAEAQRS